MELNSFPSDHSLCLGAAPSANIPSSGVWDGDTEAQVEAPSPQNSSGSYRIPNPFPWKGDKGGSAPCKPCARPWFGEGRAPGAPKLLHLLVPSTFHPPSPSLPGFSIVHSQISPSPAQTQPWFVSMLLKGRSCSPSSME